MESELLLLNKTYDGESIASIEEDISSSMHNKNIPIDNDGFSEGEYHISLFWKKTPDTNVIVTRYLTYKLVKTTKRLTFDILSQKENTINDVYDSKDYYFKASNGYDIISRSKMDIQTERLWLWGTSKPDSRSGSMVFADNDKRDDAYKNFIIAINEWNNRIYHYNKWN